MTHLILGAPIAAAIEHTVLADVARLTRAGGTVRLVALATTEDPASESYVRRQAQAAARLGLSYELVRDPCTDTRGVLDAIARQNSRADVTGIILQTPLPAGVDMATAQRALDPAKDVEGVHPGNLGELLDGDATLAPCTAAAVIECLKAGGVGIPGSDAVVIGRSRIVGRPAALLLTGLDATVTLCHRKTRDLASRTRSADIIVVAAGRPGTLTPEMVRPGAAVVDVGINEIQRDGKRAIVGDADPSVAEVAGFFTPTPGGVGPITVALLWRNAVRAALRAAARAGAKT